MPVIIFCLSRVPICVTCFYCNLDNLTILNAFKHVTILFSFLRLGLLGGLFILLLFITTVTSCSFFSIPPIVVLITIYFHVVLCALLGDVLVYFSVIYCISLGWKRRSKSCPSTPLKKGPLEHPPHLPIIQP